MSNFMFYDLIEFISSSQNCKKLFFMLNNIPDPKNINVPLGCFFIVYALR